MDRRALELEREMAKMEHREMEEEGTLVLGLEVSFFCFFLIFCFYVAFYYYLKKNLLLLTFLLVFSCIAWCNSSCGGGRGRGGGRR